MTIYMSTGFTRHIYVVIDFGKNGRVYSQNAFHLPAVSRIPLSDIDLLNFWYFLKGNIYLSFPPFCISLFLFVPLPLSTGWSPTSPWWDKWSVSVTLAPFACFPLSFPSVCRVEMQLQEFVCVSVCLPITLFVPLELQHCEGVKLCDKQTTPQGLIHTQACHNIPETLLAKMWPLISFKNTQYTNVFNKTQVK